MTTKEFLSQAYRLDQRISADLAELERLQQMIGTISAPGYEEHIRSGNTEAPFTQQIEKIMELEETIDNEIKNLVDLKVQIRQAIDSVPNVDERLILQYRYNQHLTWEQIGMELNADAKTIKRRHGNALLHVHLPANPIKI